LDVLKEGAAEGLLLGLVGHEAVADIREPSMAEFGVRLEVAQGEGKGEGEEEEK
jgi:hypothetical protein